MILLIIKDLNVPLRIILDTTLSQRLPKNHHKQKEIAEDLTKRQAGYRGEKNLRYYLNFLPNDEYFIIFDLYLTVKNHTFQIDALVITTNAVLILEVKNFTGTLFFEPVFNQFIRKNNNKTEGFPNPLLQAQRHQTLLIEWLKEHGFQSFPVDYLIVISNPSTILETPTEHSLLSQKVLHAEKVVNKILELNNHFKKKKLNPPTLCTYFLKLHSPPFPNILDKFGIQKNEIIKGIKCSNCSYYVMERAYGRWICPSCKYQSKHAHIQAINDYFLLISDSITNKQCQDFLSISNRKIVHRLLTSMYLPSTQYEKGKRTVYYRPNIEEIIKNHCLNRQ